MSSAAAKSPGTAIPVLQKPHRRIRVRRCAAWGLVAGILLALVFHRPLLIAAGSILIVDDRPVQGDAVFLLTGDRLFDTAAQWQRSHPALVVLKPEFKRQYLEEIGIRPDPIEEFREAMADGAFRRKTRRFSAGKRGRCGRV